MTFASLRRRHTRLIYKSFSYKLTQEGLEIEFKFQLEPDIEFNPRLMIKAVGPGLLQDFPQERLENLIFHLGLAELPSYWKCACPAAILIEAGKLNSEQLAWWKDLFIKGMGEFYYTNKIDFTQKDFLSLKTTNKGDVSLSPLEENHYQHSYLIPVGGGKDSSLTLGLLDRENISSSCFVLEPASPAAMAVSQAGGCGRIIQAKRSIDPVLLQLNQQGYLNGHTPFSAYLSFLTVFIAQFYGFKQILCANERSANQANLSYLGLDINHQYSKTFEYEQKFRNYARKFLGSQEQQAEYLSFLRPVYELQIARLFSKFSSYFSLFKSCNVEQQQNSWCHDCAKCLFIYILLYPFVDYDSLTQDIFNHDLYKDKNLSSLALKLGGKKGTKPLECVGTIEEVRAAFYLAVKKLEELDEDLPVVLQEVKDKILDEYPPADLEVLADKLLNSWNDENNLNLELKKVLQNSLKDL